MPAKSPAKTPSHGMSSCTARSVKYAATTLATIDGKSDIAVSPSDCGSSSSV